MEKNNIKNQNVQNSVVVVSAKEHGKVFTIKNSELTIVEYIAEHPPGYSDDEGFFVRSGDGMQMGSGYAKEVDDERNIERYIKAISAELSAVIKEQKPEQVLVFEPEHLKGMIAEHLINPTHINVAVVRYGNFVESGFDQLVEMLEAYKTESVDPSDPDSVAGEENAEEKRKILEVGEMRDAT